jgi:signal transduction histidine kinase/putative methionine-R-sulfoxide reductase with GAF domain
MAETSHEGAVARPEPVDPRVAALEAELRREHKKMALVQDVGRALTSAHGIDALLAVIMEKITELMDADRSTLYLLSEDGTQLWSKVVQGADIVEIRLKVGEGISGWVAKSGNLVNIPDAYNDTRFQPAVDLRSGYRTRSILCGPMRNTQGAIVGVLQVLNKRGGPFLAEDEALLEALAGQAAIAIENAKLYHAMLAQNRLLARAKGELEQRSYELNALFEVEQELSTHAELDELLGRILRRTMTVLSAESGSVVLKERDGQTLRFHTVAGPAEERFAGLTLPVGSGVVGWVIARGEPVVVSDPNHDERHAADLARRLEVKPRNLMCAPLIDGEEVVGAIEVLDHRADGTNVAPALDDPGFSESDLKLLVLIAGQVGKAIGLWRSRTERESKDRLASIGRMLAGVLHDLKTPMTIISGYAQLMAQTEEVAQREAYVDQILRQFDIMSGMAREVLAFARGDADIVIRKVYLHQFLDEVQTQLRAALAGRNVELEVRRGFDGTAYFDQQKMLRVIHNLARNAADAMPGGGKFTLSTEMHGETLVIEASDTGTGIPLEVQSRLFALFASGKRGGTGLGLAIVKKIVDDHGGVIDWTTGEAGTTFRIRLPRGRGSGETWPPTLKSV